MTTIDTASDLSCACRAHFWVDGQEVQVVYRYSPNARVQLVINLVRQPDDILPVITCVGEIVSVKEMS